MWRIWRVVEDKEFFKYQIPLVVPYSDMISLLPYMFIKKRVTSYTKPLDLYALLWNTLHCQNMIHIKIKVHTSKTTYHLVSFQVCFYVMNHSFVSLFPEAELCCARLNTKTSAWIYASYGISCWFYRKSPNWIPYREYFLCTWDSTHRF